MGKMPIARSNNTQTALASAATLAALLLLGYVLAYWTWAWLGPRPEPRVEPISEPAGRMAGASTLFGNAQVAPASTAPTGLAIKLIGVVSASGRKPGYALVQIDPKTIVAVRAGDDIAPGVRLEKVFPDHVTLQRAGTSEELPLAERKPAPVIVPGARK